MNLDYKSNLSEYLLNITGINEDILQVYLERTG